MKALFPIRLKSHDDQRSGRPSNKTQKLLSKIIFIYLVVFRLFFQLKIFSLISILLVRNSNARWILLFRQVSIMNHFL